VTRKLQLLLRNLKKKRTEIRYSPQSVCNLDFPAFRQNYKKLSKMASVTPRHIFGVGSSVSGALQFLDDERVLYPSGSFIVIHEIAKNKQRFIAASIDCVSISAIAVCPDKKYLAVGERTEERGRVCVYDLATLKKRKELDNPECDAKEYVSLSFSSSKSLLTLSGGPAWKLTTWQWEKAKVLSSIRASNVSGNALSACSFNPVDPSVACVTGNSIFKAFRIVDQIFKPMPNLLGQVEPQNFTSHLWLNDDRVVLGTEDGLLLLFEAGEFITELKCSPDDGNAVCCMAATNEGFSIGCEGGEIVVFRRVDDSDGFYDRVKSVNVADAGSFGVEKDFVLTATSSPSVAPTSPTRAMTRRGFTSMITGLNLLSAYPQADAEQELETFTEAVKALAISPSEEVALAVLNTNQIVSVRLSSSDPMKPNEMTYEVFSESFHRQGLGKTAKISGMDVCIRKPLLVTCGTDRSVRIWNHESNTCELVKFFPEEAHSVAFHPSGLQILVGFTDKLRLMNLLMDDLRSVKEIPIKGCRECQFAAGGQRFAAVNGNAIQVFNTYSCESVMSMRGHNGKVRSLFWSNGDSQIISAGMDGAVYQWDLSKDNKRDGEYVKKGCNYSSAITNKTGDVVFAVGSDRMLREVELPSSLVAKELNCERTLGQLTMTTSERVLFGASCQENSSGTICIYPLPLRDGNCVTLQGISAPVTRMRLSWEDRFLFVAGEDGTLLFFDVRDKERGGGESEFLLSQTVNYSEEVLVTKSDLDEKDAAMAELKSKVDELTLNNEYQLRLKDMNYNEHVKEITQEYNGKLEEQRKRYETLREEKNDADMEYGDKLKVLEEEHQQRLQQLESAFQAKILDEVERYQALCKERDEQKLQWKKEEEALSQKHSIFVNDVTVDYEQQLEEDREMKEHHKGELEEQKREFDETMRQLEEDIDKEIESLRSKFESKFKEEREITLRYKGENGIMKKKFSAMQKDIEVQKDEIKAILEKEKELFDEIYELEAEIQHLRSIIRDKDDTIGEKEKKIYDLKRKNQELEKFKFVLDYKIKDLKQQIEPRENEIYEMKEQIKVMDADLESYHRSNAELDEMIGELRSKLDEMQKAIIVNRQKLTDQRIRMDRFRGSLFDCSQQVQNPEALRERVEAMYTEHMKEEIQVQGLDGNIKREYFKQRDFLEKTSDVLKKRLETDVNKFKDENLVIMEKNMHLIQEIHELRDQIQQAKLHHASAVNFETSAGQAICASPPPRTKNPGNKMPKSILPPKSNNEEECRLSDAETRLLKAQRNEIGRLKAYLHDLRAQISAERPDSASTRLDPIS